MPNRLDPAHFSLPTVAVIKSRLWEGETCDAIALDYDVTPRCIGHIRTGRSYAAVLWPDKSKGRLPFSRQREIVITRKLAAKDLKNSIRSQTKERVSALLQSSASQPKKGTKRGS